MIRQNTPTPKSVEQKTKELIVELLNETPQEKKCPHIQTDNTGPYCARSLEPGKTISTTRRDVCDIYSLQLWCLDKPRCPKCIYYQGESF